MNPTPQLVQSWRDIYGPKGYLDRHNVRPGQAITVDEKVPSTGLIAINTGREPVSLGVNVAARIRVRPDLNAAPTTTRRSSGSPSRRAAPRS